MADKDIKSPFEQGLSWFLGVVEDVNDPLKVNRVRVRCLRYHTDNRSDLPTNRLPWATLMHSGAHLSAPNVVPGDWVAGFFLDGGTAQQPIIMGVLDGIPGASNPSIGFSDPSGIHPKQPNTPTNSPLARAANSAEVTYSTASQVPGSIPTVFGSTAGPKPDYAATYPNNHVIETDAGNIIELDDTPGAQRIRIMHTSGTSIELCANGGVIVQSVGCSFEVNGSDKTIAVNGNLNITASADVNILAGGSLNLGAATINLTASGGASMTSGSDVNISASGATNIAGDSVSIAGESLFAADASDVEIAGGMSQVATRLASPSSVNSMVVSKRDS